MSAPHKHVIEINALADGRDVEYKYSHLDHWYRVKDFATFDVSWFDFRIKPHRWQAEIDAQAAGKVIQIRGDGPWFDDSVPNFGNTSVEFRIKPETIRFRVALMKSMHLFTPPIVFTRAANTEKDAEKYMGRHDFVRWLGDWQEVEA